MNRKRISHAIVLLLGLLNTLVLSVNVEAQAPRKAQIVFVSDRDGNGEIYVMDTEGKNQRNLTNHPASDFAPAWSPDGKKIAFVSTRRRGSDDIYVMDAKGRNVQRLTDHPGSDEKPAWSPDGRKIAFNSNRDGSDDIYVMDADGKNVRKITNHPRNDYFPTWSSDS